MIGGELGVVNFSWVDYWLEDGFRYKVDWLIKEEKVIIECIVWEIVIIVLELFLFLVV